MSVACTTIAHRRPLIAAGLFVGLAGLLMADDWTQFRGPSARSAALEAHPPIEFDGETLKNIAWRADIVGRGVSGPIVVGDRVFVTSSGGQNDEEMYVSAYQLSDGKRLWWQRFIATGRPFAHPLSANAAPTPASDGERIFAFYSSNDLVCLDLDGRLLWSRGLAFDHPKAGNDVGMGSSPAVIDGVVVVQVENQSDSFAVGMDVATGQTLWEIERERAANWASPLAFKDDQGKSLILLQSGRQAVAIEPRTGEQRWLLEMPFSTVPSAADAGGLLVVPGTSLVALQLKADGPEVLWENAKLRVSSSSPVIGAERVYCAKGSVMVAGDLKTGELVWQERLPQAEGSAWSTPVVTGSGVYFFDQSGKCFVVRDNGAAGEVIAESQISGPILGSPAVVGDALLVRSDSVLWKIAAP
jgi:outer membrane protein assembly factor BamB